MLDVLVHDTKNAMMRLSGQLMMMTNQISKLEDAAEAKKILGDLVARATTESKNVCELMKKVAGAVYGGDLATIAHRPVGINELFGSRVAPVIDRFKRCQGLAVTVNAENAADTSVICSPDVFARVVENLLDNANQAKASRIFIDIVERAASVEISFRDNGEGMTENQIEELGFKAGTSGQAGRTGRGFAFARRLVADAGGVLERPRSIPGFATEIKVVLKRHVDQRPDPSKGVVIGHEEECEEFHFELA